MTAGVVAGWAAGSALVGAAAGWAPLWARETVEQIRHAAPIAGAKIDFMMNPPQVVAEIGRTDRTKKPSMCQAVKIYSA
jgi:hypothetical protein